MIKNNNFFIENLKTVVFIGHSDVLSELVKINKSLKLQTFIITIKLHYGLVETFQPQLLQHHLFLLV